MNKYSIIYPKLIFDILKLLFKQCISTLKPYKNKQKNTKMFTYELIIYLNINYKL